jgi:hypothetical protein
MYRSIGLSLSLSLSLTLLLTRTHTHKYVYDLGDSGASKTDDASVAETTDNASHEHGSTSDGANGHLHPNDGNEPAAADQDKERGNATKTDGDEEDDDGELPEGAIVTEGDGRVPVLPPTSARAPTTTQGLDASTRGRLDDLIAGCRAAMVPQQGRKQRRQMAMAAAAAAVGGPEGHGVAQAQDQEDEGDAVQTDGHGADGSRKRVGTCT